MNAYLAVEFPTYLFASANQNFRQLRGQSHVMVWDLVKTDSGNAYWQGGLLRASRVDEGNVDPVWTGPPLIIASWQISESMP